MQNWPLQLFQKKIEHSALVKCCLFISKYDFAEKRIAHGPCKVKNKKLETCLVLHVFCLAFCLLCFPFFACAFLAVSVFPFFCHFCSALRAFLFFNLSCFVCVFSSCGYLGYVSSPFLLISLLLHSFVCCFFFASLAPFHVASLVFFVLVSLLFSYAFLLFEFVFLLFSSALALLFAIYIVNLSKSFQL